MLAAGAARSASLAEDPNDVSAITSPLAPDSNQLADDGRVAFFDVQYDQTGFELPRAGIVSLEDQLRAIGAPAGLQVEFTGEAEKRAADAGHQRHHRPGSRRS